MNKVQGFKPVDCYAQNFGNNLSAKSVTSPAECANDEENVKKEGFSKKQVGGMVLATALSATVLAGSIIHRKSIKIGNLESELGGLRTKVDSLNGEIADLKSKLSKIVSETPENKSFDELVTELKAKFKTKTLDYDALTPPTRTAEETGRAKVAEYLKMTFPGIQRPVQPLKPSEVYIPQIAEDGSFALKLPETNAMKVVKTECRDFESQLNIPTGISSNYADAVVWDNDKIARDILQNFYDGHGQTLDGIEMKFEPMLDGKFRVKISGQSTYTPDKAALIGESTKRGDESAAGNYGEGLKMAALKLLRDKGASNVRVGSANWNLTYKLGSTPLSDQKVLAYDLTKTPLRDGNFIEFETSDKTLLESIRTSVNRFKHSNNPHFTSIAFENDTVAMRVLPNASDKGGIYIAGQRFEFEGSYDGLEGAILSFKKKPPKDILDPSRDRTSLNVSQLEKLARWIALHSSPEEKFQILKVLEPFFKMKGYSKEKPMDKFLSEFARYSGYTHYPGNIANRIKFPKKYVAFTDASEEVLDMLLQDGYTICSCEFSDLGMQTIKEVMCGASNHKVLQPTEIQKKKILLLKEALNKILSKLERKHFTPNEIDTKIYLFDSKSPLEASMHKSTLAEAIIRNDASEGFWLDKTYLDKSKFSDILETALHELSHKVGGDGSANFSYKLTDVNSDVLSHLLENNSTREYVQALNKIWDELGAIV